MSEVMYNNAHALDAHLKALGGDDEQVGEVLAAHAWLLIR
jgi:hypothetical protein